MRNLLLICAVCTAVCTGVGAGESEWVTRAMACTAGAEAGDLLPLLASIGDEADLCRGIVYHNLAVIEPEMNADRAYALLAPYAERTGSALASGYAGSAQTLRASAAFTRGDFLAATELLGQGCARLDQAVAREPDSTALRVLRARNGIQVSRESPVKRHDLVEQDLAFLEARTLPTALRANVHVLRAELCFALAQTDRGLRELEQAIRTAPGSAAAKQARVLLARYEE